jgi:GGDEF domain-containing protein
LRTFPKAVERAANSECLAALTICWLARGARLGVGSSQRPGNLPVSVSIGIHVATDDDDYDALLRAADHAM